MKKPQKPKNHAWKWRKHKGFIYLQSFCDPERLYKAHRAVIISNGRSTGDQMYVRFVERLLRYYLSPSN